MKKAARQNYPPGWTEKKVLAVIAHYDGQSEEEAAAEIETAPDAPRETLMSVPTELVRTVSRLIADHAKKSAPARSGNHNERAPTRKSAN